MQMPGRKYSQSGTTYRYGFNGQEITSEIFEGSTTAMFWEYDSRIGRRWNLDPVVKPWESGYSCFNNNPILITDVNGDDGKDPHKVKKGDNFSTIAKNNGTTVDKLLELNKNIKDPNKISIGQNINLPQDPSVKSKVVSTNNVYKHSEHTTTKHFFGLIEDHGQQGYDITYNVVQNTFSDEAGNESVSYDYQVTNNRATWTSSASNFGVYKFGLTSLAASKVLQVAFGGGSKLVPLGLGSTGRVTASSIMEQMVMKHIMANPNLGRVVMEGMKDSRWLGWSKMQFSVTSELGKKATIHYVAKIVNGVIKAVDDFKFK